MHPTGPMGHFTMHQNALGRSNRPSASRLLLTAIAVSALLLIVPRVASASHTVPPGCFDGQVGLFSQNGWAGNCFGFSGTNNNFDAWPGIKDNMRSIWNGGNTHRACVYGDKSWVNRTASMALDQKHDYAGVTQAESNSWVTGSCPL